MLQERLPSAVRPPGHGWTYECPVPASGHGRGGTPGPIPNPEVKPPSADGTAERVRGRAGRRWPAEGIRAREGGERIRAPLPLHIYAYAQPGRRAPASCGGPSCICRRSCRICLFHGGPARSGASFPVQPALCTVHEGACILRGRRRPHRCDRLPYMPDSPSCLHICRPGHPLPGICVPASCAETVQRQECAGAGRGRSVLLFLALKRTRKSGTQAARRTLKTGYCDRRDRKTDVSDAIDKTASVDSIL